MVRSVWPVLGVLVLVGGCVPLDAFKTGEGLEMPLVGPNPFGTPPAQVGSVSLSTPPTGDHELALRVDCVGRKVKAANPDTHLDPKFVTIGTPGPELFHQGTLVVYVTEGLVKGCKTEGELAALLCLEMGKMVSEREASAGLKTRQQEARPPLEVPIGNAGQAGAGDGVHQTELARFDKQRPKRLPPLEPQALARTYLEKAGFQQAELENVAPLLRTAEQHYVVEKQFKGPSWTAGDVPH